MSHAGAEFWDGFYRGRAESGKDLDWAGRWTESFGAPLRDAGVRTVLELGCGSGHDAARLARQGYAVTAVDVSRQAIDGARARYGDAADYRVADMTRPLAFEDASFDAVMSNVAMHCFPDAVTRSVVEQVGRLVRPGGLFLFHVNALEDRRLRAAWQPARELEPDFVLERSGQTMHFFSEPYLRELLSDWGALKLDWIEIPHPDAGAPYKRVWRGLARR